MAKIFHPSHSVPHTPFGTIRKNRLKLVRPPINNLRINFGTAVSNTGSADAGNEYGNQHHQQQQQQQNHKKKMSSLNNLGTKEQLYIKIGETNPSNNSSNNTTNSWNGHLANIYQNAASESLALKAPSTTTTTTGEGEAVYHPTGNRSVISYRSASEYGDGV